MNSGISRRFERLRSGQAGYSLAEMALILVGGLVLMSAGVPLVESALGQYRIVMAAQSITAQLQFARMKAVSSNEAYRVQFPNGERTYRVETSDGMTVAGPFSLPRGVSWNSTDPGSAISFPGNYVEFLPTGNTPASGNGSPGRAKIFNTAGSRIDLVVTSGVIVRQTPTYKTPPAAF
jgi:Tfp pilus assembly protein FimT